MVQKNLIKYIRKQLQKGYDVSAIRNLLLKYGYTNKDVDEALNSIYHPTIRHEIHLSSATIFAIVFISISLLSIASFFYFNQSKTSTKLLDLNLEPISTTVKAGESVTFVKELSNLGSSKRYDVIIKQEIIGQKTFKVITEKTETRAIETFGSTQTKILVPQDTKEGDYILRVIVEYDNKKAVATLPVKVLSFTNIATCFDGIKNQYEEGIDCGGECKSCETQIKDCNDNNPCTDDVIENGGCVNKPIAPCCGNDICEGQEKDVCAVDCGNIGTPFGLTAETLDEIKELARVNPGKALQQCNKIDVPDLRDTCISNIGDVQRNKNYCNTIINVRIKDLCYSKIAESTNDNSLCQEISTESRRDSCYAYFFVPPNKDYSVCDKVTNNNLRQSCESLRQLYESKLEQNQGLLP